MLGRAQIEALIPHAGAMCLLDRVIAWDATSIHARSASHRAATHPLRRDGRLHAIHLCEYGAQAMALHGGLLARSRHEVARPGLLVALRAVELAVDHIDDLAGDLDVHAECVALGAQAWQYTFRVSHAGAQLGSGRAMVALGALP